MFDDHLTDIGVPAVEVGEHLAELEAERALAAADGVAEIDAYKDDLDEEIEAWRRLYVASAVTEIATLRGELSGRLLG